ncbi:hypothetical protein [uncultured Alsobacter sp.]|uniref:hypothetical protein n=1 Tax=uncultured Alsobacter sp. TaxID=1748258 RepID=UPI0025DAC438|nr:hypothetical protein [uncultured Alsobacter sp.]
MTRRTAATELLAASAMALAVALAPPALAQSSGGDAVIRGFLAGSGAGGVGIIDSREEVEVEVPQAIYSGPNGEVYLLDQANSRVLKFDPSDPGQPPQVLELPEGIRPTDMVVSQDNTFYVWDGQVRALQPTGAETAPTRGLTLTRSSLAPDPYAVSALAQMGSMVVDDGDPAEIGRTRAVNVLAGQPPVQSVATRGKGALSAEVKAQGESAVQINILEKGSSAVLARLKMQVRSRLGATELLEVDRKGRYFVFGENIPTDFTDVPASFVARYASNGTLEGIYELPLSGTVGLSRRFVTVSPEGEVYFLRTRKDNADVLAVSFRPLRPDARIDTAGKGQSLADLARRKGAAAAVRPLNRQQVIETAFSFANAKWRVTPAVYGPDPDNQCTGFSRVRRPGYLNGKLNQDVQGIPYCWGCMGNLQQIAMGLNQGRLAGNICTRDDPRRDVIGVDCSSFVSAAWGLSSHFTTIAIPAITTELANPFELLPGDALNKPGSHVLLFVRFTADRKAEVIEASPGACNGRVCRNVYPLASLLARGYKPVRYKGLLNDPGPAGPPVPVAGQAGKKVN